MSEGECDRLFGAWFLTLEAIVPLVSHIFSSLTADGRLLFATRSVRMFAYGFLSVVLVLYLKADGLNEKSIGFLLTMTLLGDTAISLWITTAADRIGRKRMLILGALLMAMAGIVFVMTNNFVLLVIAATIGVLSPSDKEVGPFLSIEQAALSQTIADEHRTAIFAWYNLVGSVTAAIGALVGGFACQQFLRLGRAGADVAAGDQKQICLRHRLVITGRVSERGVVPLDAISDFGEHRLKWLSPQIQPSHPNVGFMGPKFSWQPTLLEGRQELIIGKRGVVRHGSGSSGLLNQSIGLGIKKLAILEVMLL
jgi:hypothetical protein